ncbi:MAG TPA: hypothetical protein VN750_00900 [Steroidobacteraceae bacterium]|nr:hypothetical protein [Steroidobacteraceae bacterium]
MGIKTNIRKTPRKRWIKRGRLICNSGFDGTYVRAKHGPIGQERIHGRK